MRLNQKKTTIGSAGFDLFTAKEKILIPRCVTPITIELKMEIRSGYFGKIYPRSSRLKKDFVSCKDPILIKPGQRIAQIVFHKKKKLCLKKLII